MKPENFAERKSMLLRFVALYVASIAILATVFIVLSNRQSASASAASDNSGTGTSLSVGNPNRLDSMLHWHALLLMNLDQSFLHPSDSTAAGIRKAQQDAAIEEAHFKKILDSLEEQGQDRGAVTASFRSLLAGHNALLHMLSSSPRAYAPPGSAATVYLPQRKEPSARKAAEQLTQDNAGLRQQLEIQGKNMAAMKTQVTNLQQTNEHLLSRLNQTDRSTTSTASTPSMSSTEETAKNTGNGNYSALERKAGQLSEELRFAQVDCNLSRADARQIVYNARQRKDLLTDALTTLNDLARSPDPDVQKKAKEKLGRLRMIASTVHD
jgi:hypothetical protein